LRLRADIERLADDWDFSGRDDSYLLREGRLARFDQWAAEEARRLGRPKNEFLDEAVPEHLSRTAQQFLEASIGRERFESHVSRRRNWARYQMIVIGICIALLSSAAFIVVQQSIVPALDANLLARATAAAQSQLVDPGQLALTPTGALGAGDIKLALLDDNGRVQSARGADTAPPLGPAELAVARGANRSSTRTASDGKVRYRVVAVPAGNGRALVIGQRLDASDQLLTRLAVELGIGASAGIALVCTALITLSVRRGQIHNDRFAGDR
jgi:two-component system sensor histidine kinase MprB